MGWIIGLFCFILLALFLESWQQVEAERESKLAQKEAEHKLKLELEKKRDLILSIKNLENVTRY